MDLKTNVCQKSFVSNTFQKNIQKYMESTYFVIEEKKIEIMLTKNIP